MIGLILSIREEEIL